MPNHTRNTHATVTRLDPGGRFLLIESTSWIHRYHTSCRTVQFLSRYPSAVLCVSCVIWPWVSCCVALSCVHCSSFVCFVCLSTGTVAMRSRPRGVCRVDVRAMVLCVLGAVNNGFCKVTTLSHGHLCFDYRNSIAWLVTRAHFPTWCDLSFSSMSFECGFSLCFDAI